MVSLIGGCCLPELLFTGRMLAGAALDSSAVHMCARLRDGSSCNAPVSSDGSANQGQAGWVAASLALIRDPKQAELTWSWNLWSGGKRPDPGDRHHQNLTGLLEFHTKHIPLPRKVQPAEQLTIANKLDCLSGAQAPARLPAKSHFTLPHRTHCAASPSPFQGAVK